MVPSGITVSQRVAPSQAVGVEFGAEEIGAAQVGAGEVCPVEVGLGPEKVAPRRASVRFA